ncbi:MAG: N-acetylmuramoyl-L-alanine amidase [Clostridia bacterium]|nr:N-acetylmuramoyl-L-alanine amidase [Clostridia bacterium]MDD4049332.1 N-acetylmuramoyl-L-alanine amidase [Clostridia bacterium]
MRLFIIKKRFFTWLLIVCLMGICLIEFRNWNINKEKLAVEAISWAIAGRTFIIDPGHGGEDPGKVSSSGIYEKDINLAVAKKLQNLILQGGGTVYMTRNEDKALSNKEESIRARKRADLKNRAELAQSKKADIYIALHCNSFPSERWYGAQTFYASNVPGSKELASYIQEELVEFPGTTTRKAKIDDTTIILKKVKIPTTNVELGFLSNSREEKMLQDDGYQNKLVWSIYSGIVRFLIKYGDQYRPT